MLFHRVLSLSQPWYYPPLVLPTPGPTNLFVNFWHVDHEIKPIFAHPQSLVPHLGGQNYLFFAIFAFFWKI